MMEATPSEEDKEWEREWRRKQDVLEEEYGQLVVSCVYRNQRAIWEMSPSRTTNHILKAGKFVSKEAEKQGILCGDF